MYIVYKINTYVNDVKCEYINCIDDIALFKRVNY